MHIQAISMAKCNKPCFGELDGPGWKQSRNYSDNDIPLEKKPKEKLTASEKNILSFIVEAQSLLYQRLGKVLLAMNETNKNIKPAGRDYVKETIERELLSRESL